MKDLRLAKDRAQELMVAGKFRRAAQAWSELVALEPSDTHLRLRLAEACRRGGDAPGAVEAFRAAAELFEQRQQWSAAHAALRVALEVAPDDSAAMAMLRRLEQQRKPEAPPPKPSTRAAG